MKRYYYRLITKRIFMFSSNHWLESFHRGLYQHRFTGGGALYRKIAVIVQYIGVWIKQKCKYLLWLFTYLGIPN